MSASDRPTAPRHDAKGNLKPAPFGLTPALVGMIIGDRPATGEAVVLVPVLGALTDQPERHEDPTRPSTWRESVTAEANDA